MKTTVHNTDTVLTICTYSMFTGESAYEMELEYQRNECNNNDPDISFFWDGVVRDLATESIGYLENEVLGLHIINKISLTGTYSPKFYNYNTDSYQMEINFNQGSLVAWLRCNDLLSEVEKLKDKWQHDKYEKWEPYLVVFINNIINPDRYHEYIWENETEIYSNNMQVK